MGDWAGKLVGAVCRIAGIFHGLIYARTKEPGSNQIDAETIRAAVELGHYLIPHAKAAFFEMGTDPAVDTARKILDWLVAQSSGEFSKRDCFNALRGSVHRVTELEAPLELLEKHGYIRLKPQDRTGPGRRPSDTYEINPHFFAQNTQNSQNSNNDSNCAHSAYSAPRGLRNHFIDTISSEKMVASDQAKKNPISDTDQECSEKIVPLAQNTHITQNSDSTVNCAHSAYSAQENDTENQAIEEVAGEEKCGSPEQTDDGWEDL